MKTPYLSVIVFLLVLTVYCTSTVFAQGETKLPPPSPPAAKHPALKNILSVFHVTPSIVHPNEIDAAQIEVQNNGNFTLYDVQVDFWNDTRLALHRPDKIDILQPHETKIIRGALSTSNITSGTTELFWQIIAKNETGTIMESTLFQRPLTVEDVSKSQEFNYCCRDLDLTSPLKQVKSGATIEDIKCKDDLKLIIKKSNDSPACVKPSTATKLVERGWTLVSYRDYHMPPKGVLNLNNTGIVTMGNQNYYFDTPNYTKSAYLNTVQISFHKVVFTLFPRSFHGGLPADGCGGQYYWTDAMFSDGVHELLDIFVDSQSCATNSIPIKLGKHTNPQAGLTFYGGKMRLLVREENQTSQKLNEFDGVIIDQHLSPVHVYYFFTNDASVKFNTDSEGIRLEGINDIDNLDGKHVKIFGTIMQNGGGNIKVEKLQILGSFVPKENPPQNIVQNVSFDDLFDNPDKYYNQTITIAGELREHDYPLAIAGVGCYSAEFKTSNEFVPDFISRHQLYNGKRYIGVRIGGQDDVGYSESEKLPLDLKNKQVTITGILVPSIKDTGQCTHILHKSGYILTDFKKIKVIKD